MLHRPAKPLDQTADDAHASVQAQLLERNDVEEGLEQVGEPRGTHATQSDNGDAQRTVDWHRKVQKGGIDIQPEYSPQACSDRGRWLVATGAVAHFRHFERAAILDFDEYRVLVDLEDSHVVVVLPDIYEVRRPALQHSHRRLQVEWCSRRQLHGDWPVHPGYVTVVPSTRANDVIACG